MGTVLDCFMVTLGLDNREFKKGAEDAEKKYEELVKAAKANAKAIVDAAKGKSVEEIAAAKASAKEVQAAGVKAAKNVKSAMVKESKEAADKVKEHTEKMKENFKEVAKGLLEVFGLMVAGAAMVEFVKGTMEAEVAAGRLAKTLNVDVEELEALQGAVKRVGGTTEGLDASLKGLNSRLEMIAIHGPRSKMALQVFAGLGISEVALKGKDAIGVLSLLAEKMHGMSEAKAQGLGERLGLDEGTIRLLTQGKEGMAALVKHQKELGVASAEDGAKAAEFHHSMLDLQDSASTVGRELLGVMMPALIGVAKALGGVAAWMSEHSDAVKAGIIGIATAFLSVNSAAILMGINAAIAWIAATWPLVLLVAGIGLVAAGLYLLVTHLKQVGHFFNEVALHIVYGMLKAFFAVEHAGAHMWNALKTAAMAPLEWIWNKLKAIVDIYKQEGKFLSAILHGDVKGAVGAVKTAVADAGSVVGLTPAYAGAHAGMAQHPSISNSRSSTTSTKETHVTIGTINTQATDAKGFAAELPGAIKSKSSLVDMADGGMS